MTSIIVYAVGLLTGFAIVITAIQFRQEGKIFLPVVMFGILVGYINITLVVVPFWKMFFHH